MLLLHRLQNLLPLLFHLLLLFLLLLVHRRALAAHRELLLLRRERRGADSVAKWHLLDEGEEWLERAARGELPPPRVPTVRGPLDVSNFDDYEMDDKYLKGGPYRGSPTDWDYSF